MKYSPEIVKELCDHAEAGVTNRDACAMVGITEQTLYRWLRDPKKLEMIGAYARAQAHGRTKHIKTIADSDDWRAHAWLLERTDPEHWGKAERRKVRDPGELFEAFLQGRANARPETT